MKEMRPLTMEENVFAIQNHALVHLFLQEKMLSEDVFYDVVIFGYIRAVQEYVTKPRLRTYAFSTVAWKQMQCVVSNYCRYMAVPKRAAPVVSLSAPVCSEMECTWEDVLSEQDNEFLRFETRELLKQMEKELPKQEMKIIRMKLGGWNMHEIASRERLTFQEINALLANCKDDILRILWGEEKLQVA